MASTRFEVHACTRDLSVVPPKAVCSVWPKLLSAANLCKPPFAQHLRKADAWRIPGDLKSLGSDNLGYTRFLIPSGTPHVYAGFPGQEPA